MDTPWRSHIKWSPEHREKLLKEMYSFEVKGGIPYFNCLLLGQMSSGKTSFFNTCATALKDEGRLLNSLTIYTSDVGSVTSKVNKIFNNFLFDLKAVFLI
jgi:septin family protein